MVLFYTPIWLASLSPDWGGKKPNKFAFLWGLLVWVQGENQAKAGTQAEFPLSLYFSSLIKPMGNLIPKHEHYWIAEAIFGSISSCQNYQILLGKKYVTS